MEITAYLYIIASYIVGGIPFGLLMTKLFGGIDVRTVGSGNIGATNVLRAAGKKAAVLTLIADCVKGLVPVLVAGNLFEGPAVMTIAAIAAVLGHNFPIFLGFKGGKGVATSFGVTLAVAPWLGFFSLLTWLGAALLWKYSSLAALAAFAAYPAMVFVLRSGDRAQQFLALFLFAMIYYRHRENIKRLLRGEEPRIGQKKTSEPSSGSS